MPGIGFAVLMDSSPWAGPGAFERCPAVSLDSVRSSRRGYRCTACADSLRDRPHAVAPGASSAITEPGRQSPVCASEASQRCRHLGVGTDYIRIMEASASTRAEAVGKAVRVWTGQLVDLTARNNLLYFRDLKVGTLDLGGVAPELLYGVLAGKVTTLSRLFPEDDAFTASARRARAVRNRSQEHYEERGIHTLYLACGLATWTTSTELPSRALPCFSSRPLAPRGAAQQEFDLQVTGELEVNPTLLQRARGGVRRRLRPRGAAGERLAWKARSTRPRSFEIAYALAGRARRVTCPGSACDPRRCSATSPTRSCRWCGTCKARSRRLPSTTSSPRSPATPKPAKRSATDVLDVDLTLPDHTPPADEFLVLDADSSQNYAINKVLGGQDLVIKGPPGTGKSQTISNLIAMLWSRAARRVLFVAEKRAAIDAVVAPPHGCRIWATSCSTCTAGRRPGAPSRRRWHPRLPRTRAFQGRIWHPSTDSLKRVERNSTNASMPCTPRAHPGS